MSGSNTCIYSTYILEPYPVWRRETFFVKKILLDNALEAWAMAIRYSELIMAGKVTLANRKSFVSYLHNSIELFAKQHMLDVNDYRVAKAQKTD